MKWLATFLIFFLLQDLRASAEGLTVYPTSLVLDEARRVGVLTLVNRGGEEAIYELAGYRWTEADGADHLIPDKAFIVTPPVVTLAPGEQRVVRIGVLPGGAPLAVEQAYRVRVSELQSGDVFRGNALDVRLQILLPVSRSYPGACHAVSARQTSSRAAPSWQAPKSDAVPFRAGADSPKIRELFQLRERDDLRPGR
ncbi:molecular chaperone [Hyphomonas sp. ND6WE1B]|uniref:fimbrial biogenesis chaperone n=1 Tax=Hyphomonas sp. ND6WE1B TaxID=1848191 RepID=UPI003510CF1B